MMRVKPTDGQIIEAIRRWGGEAVTSVVAVLLRVEVSWVRRQLQRMEREGIVERVPSAYAVQICWRVKP